MEIKKICTKCGVEKELIYFHRTTIGGIHGRRADCIECRKEYKAIYYQNNKKHLQKMTQDSRNRIKNGIYYEPPTKEEQKENRRLYINKYTKDRMKTDVEFKLSKSVRTMLHRCLQGSKGIENKIGYSLFELKERIETNFKEGMSWQNYGEWVIDHKKPISSFTKKGIFNPSHINMLCNLQPLWYIENAKKGDKFPYII